MGTRIVPQCAPDNRHVGLGLRGIVEGDRTLPANDPAVAERAGQGALNELNRRVARRALGLGDEEQAVDQLDALAWLEEALIHEALVPAIRQRARLHVTAA